jgi:hypothetical protein
MPAIQGLSQAFPAPNSALVNGSRVGTSATLAHVDKAVNMPNLQIPAS